MEKDLIPEFKKTLTEAYTAFPDKLAWLVVMQVPTAEPLIYVSPEIAAQLKKEATRAGKILRAMADRQSLAEELEREARFTADHMKRNGLLGVAGGDLWVSGMRIRRIAMLALDKFPGEYSTDYTQEMESLYTLDHELGHLILRNGAANKVGGHKAESACDAFAMLRHIQRHGWDTDYTRDWPDIRSNIAVVYADAEHYTTASLRLAIEKSREMGDDFFNMPLQDTAALADQVADEAAFDNATAKKLESAFRAAATDYKNYLGDTWVIAQKMREKDKAAFAFLCRETINVMKTYKNDPDIFEAGKLYLSRPVLREFMDEAAAAETITRYWKMALDFIDGHAPAFPRLTQLRGPM